jgi:hypothetical protein
MPRRQEGLQSVTFMVTREDVEWLDKLGKRLGWTRSEVLRACVGMAREDWEMLEAIGLTPERLQSWVSIAERMRSWFRQGVEEGEIPC